MKISLLFLIISCFLVGCEVQEPIQHLFNEGDVVMFKADTNKVGIVTSMNRWRGASYYTYHVKFSIPSSVLSSGNELFRYSNCDEYELLLKK